MEQEPFLLSAFSRGGGMQMQMQQMQQSSGSLFGRPAVGRAMAFGGVTNSLVSSNSLASAQSDMPTQKNLPKKPEIVIRKEFPETWIFDSCITNADGVQTMTRKVPDSITSWIITGFAINNDLGLGMSQATKLNVFQPFFVATSLPYSIIRGEVVSVPVQVFNYMENEDNVDVKLFNADNEFELINDVDSKSISVKSNSGASVAFTIKPSKVGQIKIKVVVSSAIAGDGFEKFLIVEPEGVTQFVNKSIFIDLRETHDFKSKISIEIPENVVPDSTKIEVAVTGDILGTSFDNMHKLIKLSYGCGEQNMLNFVPNIIVMEYLGHLKKLTPEIAGTAKKFMEAGYQRELTYKHGDGSYSAFGGSDRQGSTWLTAFVAKSFNQATKYIAIEDNIIDQALQFLSNTQAADGSFAEKGTIFHKEMQGGSSSGIALTAYTLITFLENNRNVEMYQKVIDEALFYIEKNIEKLEDNYSLAITAYAMQLAQHKLKDSLMAKLKAKAETKDGFTFWHKSAQIETKFGKKQSSSINVEMTAYALHAFIAAGLETEAIPIMKWLLSQRNENGGFHSTQDTCVGLHALSKMAAKIYAPNSDIKILLSYQNDIQAEMNVNKEKAMTLQKVDLPKNAKHVDVSASGSGFSFLQVSYKYNVNAVDEPPRFKIQPELLPVASEENLHLVAAAEFIADKENEQSNMAVMEISLPSGFTFDNNCLAALKMSDKVKRVETKNGETIVVIYFDYLDAKQVRPEIKAHRAHKVQQQKPAAILVYDYYDTSKFFLCFLFQSF